MENLIPILRVFVKMAANSAFLTRKISYRPNEYRFEYDRASASILVGYFDLLLTLHTQYKTIPLYWPKLYRRTAFRLTLKSTVSM